MESDLQTLIEALQDVWRLVEIQAQNLLLPSRLWQIGTLAAAALAAWLASLWAGRAMRRWLHERPNWPKWRLRLALIVQRRLDLIVFVALAWGATWSVRAVTPFPSRSFILEIVATIATAILAVSLAGRLLRSPVVRRPVVYGLWAFVVLYFLGLTDEAAALLDGLAFEMGDFRLTALTLLQALVAIAVLFTLARWVSMATSARIRTNPEISPSMQVLAVKILQILLYGGAFLVGLSAVGVDLTGFAVLSGAIGVGLGFGLQKVVSNLVSGVILLLDRSIKPGDVISLGETFGWINALGARYVSITTRDGKEYLIPNEDLITGQVVNWSHSNDFVRLDIHFGTAYGNDPHLVRRVAREAAAGVDRVLSDRPPVCHIVGFGDSSVDYILRFWIRDPVSGLTNIRGNVYLALWDAFKANGITIPFPQREVRVLGDAPAAARPEAD